MKKNKIFMILVLLLILISLSDSFFSYFEVKQYSMDRIVSSPGEINLFISPVCEDGNCDSPFETCETCPGDCGSCDDGDNDGGGGGGGGSGSSTQINFIFSPDVLQERLFPEESVNRVVTVTNIGSRNIQVLLDVLDLEDFVFLNKEGLSELRADEYDTFEALLSVGDSVAPGVYLGSVTGSASGIEKSLPIILTVDEVGAPIYVNIILSETFEEVFAGETIQGDIIIINNLDSVQVDITNSIKNWKEEEILSRSGQLDLISGENLFTDEFIIPEGSPPGYYLYYVNVSYQGKSYTDAIAFKVKTRRGVEGLFLTDYVFYFWFILLLTSLVFIVFFLRRFIAKQNADSLILGKKKKEDEEKKRAYSNLANDAIAKIKEIKSKGTKGKYTRALIRKHSFIVRRFFSKYYKVKASLTFEELVVVLSEKGIKKRVSVISFLNKMAHVPYDSTLISKSKFGLLIDDSIKLLSSYRGETYNGKE